MKKFVKKNLKFFSLCALLFLLSACVFKPRGLEERLTYMPNPASVFCEENGGYLVIRREGSAERGFCKFSDGIVVDEWEYFHARGDLSKIKNIHN
ncbi:MAG: DUF333 domain-containing protein [Campylobacter sp.]|nr:DUF333 domain-containing protein [Campylobacter sp.]